MSVASTMTPAVSARGNVAIRTSALTRFDLREPSRTPVSNNEMDSYSLLTVVTPTSTVTADWASKEGAATNRMARTRPNIAASAARDADKLGRLLQAVFKRRSGRRESLTGAGPPGQRTR